MLGLQVPIFEILRKYDGERIHDDIKNGRRKYRITRLPRYLVLHMKRFQKNNFFVEKNPTIVNFPVKNLELEDIVALPKGAPCCLLVQPVVPRKLHANGFRWRKLQLRAHM